MIKLRDYQSKVLEDLDAWFMANPEGHPIVSACVGAGKSVMIAEFCRRAVLDYPGYRARILMLVPSKELLRQNLDKLQHLANDIYIGIVSASHGRKDVAFDKDVVIATVGSVARNPGQLGRLDIILVDECFAAGTMISTPKGCIPIENIKTGDIVNNAIGTGKVKATKKSIPSDILLMRFSNGTELNVTRKHPFFTRNGWTTAEKLEVGSSVFCEKDMQFLRETLSTLDKNKRIRISSKFLSRGNMEQAKLLFNILLKESEQSYEQKSSSNKNDGIIATYKAQANQARWKREASADTTTCSFTCFRGRMGIGSSNTNKNKTRKWISDLLQNRYSKHSRKNCYRTGRSDALWRNAEKYRCKKRQSFGTIRLESVTNIERKSDEFVFNLHIEGHPSYFANGILVHNCHLISRKEEGQYRQLISACQKYNPALRVIGLSGTPFRGNGVWLTEGDERLFTGIAARVTMRELLDQGYLSPLVNAQTETRIDATGVRMQNGDFVVAELAKRIDKDELTRTIAKQIVEHGASRKKWLVYCVTVEHAHHMAEALEDLGVTVAVISAKTPAKERDEIIQDFRRGRVKCVCNVAVLTTGFDVPELDMIALVRNSRSPVLYTQIAGRGMRLAEGKTDCLWLDFTDTTAVMGPVDQVKGRLESKPRNGDAQKVEKTCPECGNSVPTATAICPNCQHEFPPPELNVGTTISGASILSEIKFNTYAVNRVTYSYHRNPNKLAAPPTLRVTYWSGLRRLCSEWVCFEHQGIAREKAKAWWRERSAMPSPKEVNEALLYSDSLAVPASIVLKEGAKYPELVRCIFEEVAA